MRTFFPSIEQGKTFADAKGDVLRGLQVCFRLQLHSHPPCQRLALCPNQVVESMCSLPNMLLGDKLEVARDMDTYVRRSPLGVGAAICP